MNEILTCHELSVRYGSAEPALVSCNAVFGAGLTAVIGPNGSGKSTLLRTLAGITRPAEGSVRLDGSECSSIAPKRRAARIAYVPQRSNLWAAFTCREVVALGRFAVGQDEGAVDRVLAETALTEQADMPFAHLSVGQQQRATLARGLVQLEGDRSGPRVLLADEPTSALDPSRAREALAILHERATRGWCVIMAVHDCTMALRSAARTLLLDAGGTIQAHGPSAEVLTPGRLERLFGTPFELLHGPGGPVLTPAWGNPIGNGISAPGRP